MKARFWLDLFRNYQFTILGQSFWLRVDRKRDNSVLLTKRYARGGYCWLKIPRMYENAEKA